MLEKDGERGGTPQNGRFGSGSTKERRWVMLNKRESWNKRHVSIDPQSSHPPPTIQYPRREGGEKEEKQK
jgi:hypothetical protein